jgi:SAM-dependent methyltransferase
MLEAYEAAAPDYDRHVQGDGWMRNVLWDRYARLFCAGQTVLDLGCGTGIDAIFLAKRGIRVLGIDASPAMIAESRAKLAAAELEDLLHFRVMDIAGVGSLPRAGFDGIICAFAALSTIAELDEFAASVARLLVPRGILVVHLLNRWSLWEWLGLVRSGRFGAARRLGRDPVRTFMIAGRPVAHYLYHPGVAYARFFESRFALRRADGIGILRPPHTVQRIPAAIVSRLDRLERPLRGLRPFRDWGRFFILELERR